MKYHKAALVVSVIAFGLSFAVLTHAQTSSESASPSATAAPEVFDFTKAYKDYVFIVDQYNKAHADYLLARAQYLQAKTLASQTKARDATAVMIETRDDVMATYLTALRLKLSESEGVNETVKNGIYTRIDNDVLWWKSHKSRINSAGSLEDLQQDSDAASKHFPTLEVLSYEVLSNISLGKELVLRNELNTLLSRTKEKIAQIRANGDHDTTNSERWVAETEQKLTRSLDKEIEAQKQMELFSQTKPGTQARSETYNQVVFRLNESVLFLKEANGYMKEVIKDLKIKQ